MKSKLKNKTICFDLDNVICKTDNKKNYKNSKPIKLAIKKVNDLKKIIKLLYLPQEEWVDIMVI